MLTNRPIAKRVSPAPPTISLFLIDERRKGTLHAHLSSASILEDVPLVWTTPSTLPDETNDMEDLCHI